MPRYTDEESDLHGRMAQRQYVPDPPSPAFECDPEYAASNEWYTTPFYVDPSHVAYGWPQIGLLPDFPGLYTLVQGAYDDPPLSSEGPPQNWPANGYEQTPTRLTLHGFNRHPLRGGPRRPPPLIESRGRDEHSYKRKNAFEPFVDTPSTRQHTKGVLADADQIFTAQPILKEKDVNHHLRSRRADGSRGPWRKVTDDSCVGTHPRAKRPVVDGYESTEQSVSVAEPMPSLVEEPAPLKIRKKRADSDNREDGSQLMTRRRARKLRDGKQKKALMHLCEDAISADLVVPKHSTNRSAKTVASRVTVREVSGPDDDTLESITAAIKEWEPITAAEKLKVEFEHRSAVPKALNLAAIGTAKKGWRKSSAAEAEPGHGRAGYSRESSRRANTESTKSFTTGVSSDFEDLSTPNGSEAEHNGSRRKWYRVFRRSE